LVDLFELRRPFVFLIAKSIFKYTVSIYSFIQS